MRGDSAAPPAADFRFDVDAQWEKTPAGVTHADVSAVGVDSADRVYLLTRHDANVLVYEPDGTFVTAWGGDNFTRPHGLTVGPDDSVWTVDDGDHTVRKYSPDGKLLMTLGRPGQPSDTGREGGGPVGVHTRGAAGAARGFPAEGAAPRRPCPPWSRSCDGGGLQRLHEHGDQLGRAHLRRR